MFRGPEPEPPRASKLIRARRRAARLDGEIAQREAEVARLRALIAETEALRAQVAEAKAAALIEARDLGLARVRVPFRASLRSLDRLRDAVAGVQALGYDAMRMEAVASLSLLMGARYLERRFNDGKQFAPRGDDLKPGRRVGTGQGRKNSKNKRRGSA